jgi:hypothetical protein
VATESTLDILPDSRTKSRSKGRTGSVMIEGVVWVPVYCANCGKTQGLVPEENITFAFFLCDDCAEKMGPIAGTYMEPDEVFYQKVAFEMQEKYGRILTARETLNQLGDVNSPLSRLARERQLLTPHGG